VTILVTIIVTIRLTIRVTILVTIPQWARPRMPTARLGAWIAR
jgi:hypothetical protein